MEKIKLSRHFGWKELLIYSLPAIGNMLAITSFGVIDGFFAANLLGEDAFVATLLIGPFFFVVYAIGFMFGSGTSAQVSRHLGSGDEEKGRRIFSMSVFMAILTGVVLGIVFSGLMPYIAEFLQADEGSYQYCVDYGRILFLFLPAFMISSAFQSLWITAECAVIGLIASVCQGILNVFLDWLLMGPFNMGVTGAALATGIAAFMEALFCVLFFWKKGRSDLHFVRFSGEEVKETGRILFNGISDLVDSASENITTMILNFLLIKYIGDIGVAAFGVYNYVAECFMAFFFGISSTAVTIVGYKCGMRDKKELDGILKNGIVMMTIIGFVMWILCYVLAGFIARLFLNYDPEAVDLTIWALRICAFGFVLAGVNLFVSSFFTGLEDGLASGGIAMVFSLIGPLGAAMAITEIFGGNAIWYAVPAAAAVAAVVCTILIKTRYAKINLNEIEIDMDEFE